MEIEKRIEKQKFNGCKTITIEMNIQNDISSLFGFHNLIILTI